MLVLSTSCSKDQRSSEVSLITHKNEKALRAIRLTDDDFLILEVHYPAVLQKLLIQQSLKVKDVLILHEIGIEGHILIHLMKYTGSNFMLTADDVVTMQLGGVPYNVINFMIES